MALDDVRQAAGDYAAAGRSLRAAVAAEVADGVPVAPVARAAGVTRQTVYNWLLEAAATAARAAAGGVPDDDEADLRVRAGK